MNDQPQHTTQRPGIIRRTFSLLGALLGKIASIARWLVNILFLLFLAVILFSFIGEEIKPLPEKAALRIAPSGFLVEQRSYQDPLLQLFQDTEFDRETPVRDLVEVIDKAAADKRITALVLEPDKLLGGGITKLETLGAALRRFKASGKPIIAVADNYTQDQYYLASHADEIYLNPMGTVLLTGYGAYGSYLKELTDKLKMNVHIFRAGQFKDAVEPFSRNNMSEESRAHTRQWLKELWQVYTSRVEQLRGMPVGAIDDYINNMDQKLAQLGGDATELALRTGLIDQISTRADRHNRLLEIAGADNDGGDYVHVDYKDYLKHLRLPGLSKAGKPASKIGVIVASGNILDGEHPEGVIGGDSLSRLLQQARQDTAIKAIVLRIDSPGGSAFASDIIRQEILLTRKSGIPVVVSMGSVAASGGYWIAADADRIVAAPTTLTGSIGVFGIVPTFEDSLSAIGIYSDGVGTTRLADLYHLDRPLSPQARRLIQLSVDNIYNNFINLVAKARNSTPAAIHEIAQGHVWTGAKALELGLVDELGSQANAVAVAAKLAGLESYETQHLHRPLSFEEKLLRQLSQGTASIATQTGFIKTWLSALVGPGLKTLARELDFFRTMNDPRGLYLHCFACY